jgi:hypothetical protein
MKVAILSIMAVAALGGVARADDDGISSSDSSDDNKEDEFLSLGAIPQIGIGINLTDTAPRFDGTLRGGKVFRMTKHLHAGGFVELHTLNFDGFDAAIGPQVQIELGNTFALQLRGGVGAAADHGSFGVVGAQIGNFITGVTVSARRPLDGSGPTEFSANVELSSALLLLPVWLASDPFGKHSD